VGVQIVLQWYAMKYEVFEIGASMGGGGIILVHSLSIQVKRCWGWQNKDNRNRLRIRMRLDDQADVTVL